MQAKAAEQGAAVDVNGRLIVVEDDGTIIIGPGREQAAAPAARAADAKDSTEVEYLTGERGKLLLGGPGQEHQAGFWPAGGIVQRHPGLLCGRCCLQHVLLP